MSVTASIVASRSSGRAPLFVHFDATGTTSTATSTPFHDLDYFFDFDDVGAGNFAYGSGVNPSKETMYGGPLAAHVFETAGTYNVSVTGLDGTSVDDATTTITVYGQEEVTNGYTQLHFFSNDTTYAAGTPADDATRFFRHDSVSDFDSAISTYKGTGRSLNFEWGDTFTASASSSLNQTGGCYVGANPHGSGTKPIVNASGAIAFFSASANDNRIVNLDCRRNGNNAYFFELTVGSNDVTNTLLLGCYSDAWPSSGNCIWLHDAVSDGAIYFGIVDCDIQNTGSGSYGFFGTGVGIAFLGSRFDKQHGGTEHTIRSQYLDRCIFNNCDFAGGVANKHVLKLHSLGDGASSNTENIISDCIIRGGTSGWVVTIGPENAIEAQETYDFIYERNMHMENCRAVFWGIQRLSLRNNVFNLDNGQFGLQIDRRGIEQIPVDNNIYNNTFYASAAVAFGTCVSIAEGDSGTGDADQTTVKNNLAYAPSSTSQDFILIGAGATNTVQSNNSAETGSPNSEIKTLDPVFVDSTPNNAVDFDIQSSSPYIADGATWVIGLPIRDMALKLRLLTGALDVGAFTYAEGMLPGAGVNAILMAQISL